MYHLFFSYLIGNTKLENGKTTCYESKTRKNNNGLWVLFYYVEILEMYLTELTIESFAVYHQIPTTITELLWYYRMLHCMLFKKMIATWKLMLMFITLNQVLSLKRNQQLSDYTRTPSVDHLLISTFWLQHKIKSINKLLFVFYV